MLNQQTCVHCDKKFKTHRGLLSHISQVHDPNRKRVDRSGNKNPHFGKQGKNQYTYLDWNSVPWETLNFKRKRLILLEETKFRCSSCGFDKRRDDGGCILEIDHIDGDHLNNARENLRVLCPNCHALTLNFRNWGRTSKRKTSTRLRRENKDFSK